MQAAHCKGRYYREFAYKSLPGEFKSTIGREPIDLFRLRHTPIKNEAGLMRLVNEYRTRPGLYVSVYAFSGLKERNMIDYKTAKIDRIYLDFDHKDNPQKAIDEALLTIRSLTRHRIYPVAYFTGNKGVAFYIDFITIEIAPENKKNVIARFFDLVVKTVFEDFSIKLETLDPQVRGDIARVSRLPNTRHSVGYYCIPISPGDMRKGLDYIKALASRPRDDFDLENAITNNMVRNQSMPILIKNIEKQIIAEQEQEKHLFKMKKKYYEELSNKRKRKKDTGIITDIDIEKAKSVPLSDFTGRAKMICCPFHHDMQPSLSIDHDKNLWHCFGCGRGGSVIDWIMESDGVGFKAAVQELLGVTA